MGSRGGAVAATRGPGGHLSREVPELRGLPMGAAMRGILGEPAFEFEPGGGVEARAVELALHPRPGGLPDGIVLLLCHGGLAAA